jgi:hypothetical protein
MCCVKKPAENGCLNRPFEGPLLQPLFFIKNIILFQLHKMLGAPIKKSDKASLFPLNPEVKFGGHIPRRLS